jgi:hypothetical protein
MMRLMSWRIRLHFVCAVGFKSSHSNASPSLQLGACCSRDGASLCLRHERVEFFHRLFFIFFLGSLVQIEEGQHKLGPLAFQQRGPQLPNDPVAHLTAEYQTELARVSSQDVGARLTRVSAIFSAATREVSQNWNRIRIMSDYGRTALGPKADFLKLSTSVGCREQ